MVSGDHEDDVEDLKTPYFYWLSWFACQARFARIRVIAVGLGGTKPALSDGPTMNDPITDNGPPRFRNARGSFTRGECIVIDSCDSLS